MPGLATGKASQLHLAEQPAEADSFDPPVAFGDSPPQAFDIFNIQLQPIAIRPAISSVVSPFDVSSSICRPSSTTSHVAPKLYLAELPAPTAEART